MEAVAAFEMSKKSNKGKNGMQSISHHPAMAINQLDHDQRAEPRHYDGSLTTQGTVSTLLRSASFDKTSGIEWFWRTWT